MVKHGLKSFEGVRLALDPGNDMPVVLGRRGAPHLRVQHCRHGDGGVRGHARRRRLNQVMTVQLPQDTLRITSA